MRAYSKQEKLVAGEGWGQAGQINTTFRSLKARITNLKRSLVPRKEPLSPGVSVIRCKWDTHQDLMVPQTF